MRPGEYWEALAAWREDKEADRRHVAELIRGVGVRLFNIQLRPADRITDSSRFMPMPWDENIDEAAEIDRLANLSAEEKNKEAQAFLESINFK